MIRETIEALVEGQSLSMEQAGRAMGEIMDDEATPAQIGAFVTALRLKRETADEIAGMAQIMRERALRVDVAQPVMDVVGTGGDASGSFNISTTTALVVAGAGVAVAKHGNRAMSGACGSADVLEALGVKIDLSPEGVERCLEEVGFGFMFAQRYHPSMRFAAGPRREIGIRTVFNILGPLTNPAGAEAYLMGVADASVAEKMAHVLGTLGASHALVVHGADGLDEITLDGPTEVWELRDGSVSASTIRPEQAGIVSAPRQGFAATGVDDSARILRGVLRGEPGPARDVVLLNAAAALLAADRVTTLKDGAVMAAESIDGGKALRKLDGLVTLSQRLE